LTAITKRTLKYLVLLLFLGVVETKIIYKKVAVKSKEIGRITKYEKKN
jgi:hypothetical protein